MIDVTANYLRSVLLYSKKYDEWFWIARGGQHVPGDTAGSIDARTGYRRIVIDGRAYFAHRLVWLWTYGGWPSGIIDHIDGNKLNCRIENLRDTTINVNAQNRRRPHKDGSSGFLGVSEHKGKWQASIRAKNKLVYLGRFNSPEQAHEAYLCAKRKLHEGCTI